MFSLWDFTFAFSIYYCGAQWFIGPAQSLMRSPPAQTEGDEGPSSELGNKKWPKKAQPRTVSSSAGLDPYGLKWNMSQLEISENI